MAHRNGANGMTAYGLSLLVVACVLTVSPAATVGHPLSVLHGEMRVDGDRLVVAIEVSAHDIEYLELDPNDLSAINDVAERMARAVVALDDRGARLADADASLGQRAWRLNDEAHFITLLLHPGISRQGVPPRQLRLRAMRAGDRQPADVLNLTGPQAAEIVDLRALRDVKSTDDRPIVLPSKSFRTARVSLTVRGHEVAVIVDLPAPVIDSWRLMPRADADVLKTSEIDRQAAVLKAWLVSHASLRIDGNDAVIRPEIPEWLSPEGGASPRDDCDVNRCFWSARVRLRAVAKSEAAISRVELVCSPFNVGVLGVEGAVVHDGNALLTGTLTSFSPKLVWERGPQGMRAGVGQVRIAIPE